MRWEHDAGARTHIAPLRSGARGSSHCAARHLLHRRTAIRRRASVVLARLGTAGGAAAAVQVVEGHGLPGVVVLWRQQEGVVG